MFVETELTEYVNSGVLFHSADDIAAFNWHGVLKYTSPERLEYEVTELAPIELGS